jgi:hypothetical protein
MLELASCFLMPAVKPLSSNMCDDSTPSPQGELLKDGKMLKWRLKRWFWIEMQPPQLVYSGSQGSAARGFYKLDHCYCRADIAGSAPDGECAIVLILPSGLKKFYPTQELPFGERVRAVHAWVDAITFSCNRAAARLHMKLELKKHIGAGFCSHVYLALRQSDGATCACKITDKQRMGPESAAMLETEADMQRQLMALGCDGFLKLIDANIKADPFRAYLVTELCSGGEIYDYACSLPPERFNERMVAEIMRSVLRCVEVMHANGFVHRDLKLENILLSTLDTFVPIPQRIRLADFGFICRTDGGLLTLQCGAPSMCYLYAQSVPNSIQARPRTGHPRSSTRHRLSRTRAAPWTCGVQASCSTCSSHPPIPSTPIVRRLSLKLQSKPASERAVHLLQNPFPFYSASHRVLQLRPSLSRCRV